MLSLPGAGPAVSARTQLLNNSIMGGGSRTPSASDPTNGMRAIPAPPQARNSNAVQKAAANAARMLLTRARTQQAIARQPSEDDEETQGQALNPLLLAAVLSAHLGGA